MNHIGRYDQIARNPLRHHIRSQRRALYAIFDFDCSIMFPRTSTPSERRLLASNSFITGGNFAYDTAQGELDYDPFAFDVGALGQLFCEMFQVRHTTQDFFFVWVLNPMTASHSDGAYVGPVFG